MKAAKTPAPKPQPTNSISPMDDIKWRAKEAMHTIAKAEEHRKDRELMREVKRQAKHLTKAVCK